MKTIVQINQIIGLLFVLALFCGCGGDNSASSDCILSVNGVKLSAGTLESYVNLRVKLRLGTSSRKIDVKKLTQALTESAPEKFITDTIISQYALEHGVVVDERICEHHVKRISRQQRQPYELTAEELSILRNEIRSELLRKAVCDDVIKNADVHVDECEVIRRREIWDMHNRDANMTNALVFATASNVWQKIVGGHLTYEDAYNRYDEGEKNGQDDFGYWGEYPLQAFEGDSVLARMLATSRVGDVLMPCEGDNGVVIVKVLPSNGGITDNQFTQNKVPLKKYNLARIFFRMADVWPDETNEQLREDLLKIKQNDFLSSFMSDLRHNAKIVWSKKEEKRK